MAEFSYESDIAPMRGTYFSNENLNDRERKQLQTDYLQKIAPYQDITNKTLDRMFDVQNQEISFRRANLAFEDEKLKLQEARDAATKYPEITKQLEDAMLGKKSVDQRLLVADIEMKNPSFFATPNGNALLSAVKSKISASATTEAVEQAKSNQLWNMAAQLGMPDIAEQVASGGINPDAALSEITKRKKEEDMLEKQQKINTQLNEDILKFQAGYIADDKKLYRNVKLVGGKEVNYSDSEAAGGSGSAQVLPENTKFTETYRANLIDGVSRYTDKTVEELNKEYGDGTRDKELYDLFGKRVRDNETQLFRSIGRLGYGAAPAATKIDLTEDDRIKGSLNIKPPQ
jgi:hypothetical protein